MFTKHKVTLLWFILIWNFQCWFKKISKKISIIKKRFISLMIKNCESFDEYCLKMILNRMEITKKGV